MGSTVLCVIGTRPEAIKMAPVIRALHATAAFSCRVLVTGQHREMLDQTLLALGIEADIDLDCMRHQQSLTQLTARMLEALEQVLRAEQPAVVLAQGDTSSVFCTALACFYQGIAFGHIEAGLRTFDLAAPFPEEGNRQLASRLARWHFAPTQSAVDNLLAEGIAAHSIYLTGNTGIDAMAQSAQVALPASLNIPADKRLVLVTLHRRENFGEVLHGVCQALRELARSNADIHIVFPVHPNPAVRDTVYASLNDVANLHLCEPLAYGVFATLMRRAYLVISDSGGVQEEAPALGIPALVLREKTERPEAVALGVVRLVGSAPEAIVRHTQQLLDDRALYDSIARPVSPYGDGQSAQRIVEVLMNHLAERP
jgi:UDP-N-acetylglucosamine 2-epimerase (non-hydrolysing)